MRLTLAEPKYLKDSISIISDLVNEATFKIKPSGIELIAMDPASVAMVIYNLLSSSFTEYELAEEMSITINLANLKQILRRVGPSDIVTISVTEDNKLQILIKGSTTRTFSIPIIETEDKEQRIPDLTFQASITTSSSTLNEAIEDVDIVSESVTFTVEPKKFTVSAEGDLNRAKIEIREGEETKIKYSGKEKSKSKYSIEYLKKMIGGSKLADEVTIEFNNDYPLRLEYKTLNKVQLAFILAPRVDND